MAAKSNPVAKYAGKFNRAVTMRDRKNDYKRETLSLSDCLAEYEEEAQDSREMLSYYELDEEGGFSQYESWEIIK